MAIQQTGTSSITRAPRPSSLADVLDLILDKGLVIDAYARVSVVGIEVLTIDLRVVVASVDTYLRFAEAVNRLDLAQNKDSSTLKDLQGGRSKEEEAEGGVKGAFEGARDFFRGGDEEKEPARNGKRGGSR